MSCDVIYQFTLLASDVTISHFFAIHLLFAPPMRKSLPEELKTSSFEDDWKQPTYLIYFENPSYDHFFSVKY